MEYRRLISSAGGHPRVSVVHYPARCRDGPRGQLDGGGALISFEVTGGARAVVAAVRLITPAVSLGSVDTLIQQALTTYAEEDHH